MYSFFSIIIPFSIPLFSILYHLCCPVPSMLSCTPRKLRGLPLASRSWSAFLPPLSPLGRGRRFSRRHQKLMLQFTPNAVAYKGFRFSPLPITAGVTFRLRSLDMSNCDNSAST